jgi:aspartyl-tRNA(Asn)/glutamyl-tRNA(Gln) amidotransferase subunit A
MLGQDILYLSVRELGKRLRERTLSPVELTESYLARAQTLGATLNAFATLTPERALDEAHAAEREIRRGRYRGPLHGIPYAAKDLLAVRGYPTQWGARPFADQHFDEDATVIRHLHNVGAILLGKAAMIELAGGMGYRFANASITGPAKNPWSPDCWTCGSSSGSGAIVAAGLAAFAIGSETWGSIVCPSAYCGVSGLRPTYGRVSRHGAMALSYSMDKLGPMARSADDCALVLEAIAEHDSSDPGSLPEAVARFAYSGTSIPRAGLRRRVEPKARVAKGRASRLGWLTNQWKDVPAEVAALVDAAKSALEGAGAQSAPAELPDGPWEAAAGLIISVEGASAFQELIESGKVAQLVDPAGQIGGYINEQIAGSDFLRAMRVRAVLQAKMDELFGRFDVLAAASLPVTATRIEANLDDELSFSDPLGGIGNLCGLPAVSVPCGFTSKNLPVGIQFVGRPLGEAAVVEAANLFQKHTDWHLRRPPVAG